MDILYHIMPILAPLYFAKFSFNEITTKNNKISRVEEIENWKEIGLKSKSYIRIEIPQRIEKNQLIGKITTLPKEQFLRYYKLMLEIFNVDIIEEILRKDEETSNC